MEFIDQHLRNFVFALGLSNHCANPVANRFDLGSPLYHFRYQKCREQSSHQSSRLRCGELPKRPGKLVAAGFMPALQVPAE